MELVWLLPMLQLKRAKGHVAHASPGGRHESAADNIAAASATPERDGQEVAAEAMMIYPLATLPLMLKGRVYRDR